MHAVRDHLQARLVDVEAARRESERRHRTESDRLVAALEQARGASQTAARLRAEQAEAARVLRTELDRQRQDREALEAETRRHLVALHREWENERQHWLELLGAGRPEALEDRPLPIQALASSPPGDSLPRSIAARRYRLRAAAALQPRPQACSQQDPQAFRTQLEQWLAEARARLQGLSANPGRPPNQALSAWLEYEIRTAREEIDRLVHEVAT
jgi:hypothetical protein